MSVMIYPLRLGMTQCYLVRGDGTILVDGGPLNQATLFLQGLTRLGIQPKEIGLIVLTHAHNDHVGSVKEIQDICGAPIALHWQEKDLLEKGQTVLPKGVTPWGRILLSLMKRTAQLEVPAAKVDLVLNNAGFPLSDYGIPGKIVYTPGHSLGSVSVLLDNGAALVGDLAMNGFPLRLGPGLPILADNMEMVYESWHTLLNQGAQTVYPGHGKAFPAEVMRKACP
ncbi:MAG: MBL fold metallo-hydrolase [Anaerolineae bacterium]